LVLLDTVPWAVWSEMGAFSNQKRQYARSRMEALVRAKVKA